jgi:hypothetical protein
MIATLPNATAQRTMPGFLRCTSSVEEFGHSIHDRPVAAAPTGLDEGRRGQAVSARCQSRCGGEWLAALDAVKIRKQSRR